MKKIFLFLFIIVSLTVSAQDTIVGGGSKWYSWSLIDTCVYSDTIVGRSPNYYYSSWYDTCDFFLNGVDTLNSRTCLAWYNGSKIDRVVHSDNTMGDTLRVKGLSCMVWKSFTGNHVVLTYPFHMASTDKLPEYLYLGSFDREKNDFIVTDSLRWDTVAPKLMKLPRHLDTSAGYEYCEAYEVYFDHPVLVHGRFEIGGSMYSNEDTLNTTTLLKHFPTFYVGVYYESMMPYGSFQRCFQNYIFGNPLDTTWYRTIINPRYYLGSGNSRTNPFHLIVQPKRWVEVSPCDTSWGRVEGGGHHYDSTYADLLAVPNRGYAFSHWNDGDTTNPRRVHVTSDTAFVAYYTPKALYKLEATTSHPGFVTVFGSGLYYDGDTATLLATNTSILSILEFDQWDDGDTTNPRQVAVSSDTSFKALFRKAEYQEIDDAQLIEFTLTPNPTHDYVTVATRHDGDYQVLLRDESGRLLDSFRAHEPAFRLDLSALPAGVYYITLKSGQHTGTQKVVKQ